MAMNVTTKDTTALSDAELAEMADLCVDREPNFDIGFLSKQREDWVLVTHVREGNKLRGYSFCTLERIGGTPSLLVGLLLVDRNAKSDQTLKAILHDQFRRALLAFPDEDVLLGSRLTSPDGYRAFAGLEDVVPRLGLQADGRGPGLGPSSGQALRLREVDRRQDLHHDGVARVRSVVSTTSPPRVQSPRVSRRSFAVKPHKGQRLVVFGWAMAEALASGKLPK